MKYVLNQILKQAYRSPPFLLKERFKDISGWNCEDEAVLCLSTGDTPETESCVKSTFQPKHRPDWHFPPRTQINTLHPNLSVTSAESRSELKRSARHARRPSVRPVACFFWGRRSPVAPDRAAACRYHSSPWCEEVTSHHRPGSSHYSGQYGAAHEPRTD